MRLRYPLYMLILSGCFPSLATADFTPLKPVAASGSFVPHLAVTGNDDVVMSWLERVDDGHVLRFAVLSGDEWSKSGTVSSGDNWFANWADFPSVVPINNQFWAAHWLVSQPAGGYAYDVVVAVSNDAGQSWSEPFLAHDDGTATEHGFVSFFSYQDGAGLIWLDGRNMAGATHQHGSDGDGDGMTLRSALVTSDAKVRQPQLVDGLVCDCCQTDMALSDSGPVAVFRNRTEQEIRDIYFSRLVDGRWDTPRSVSNDQWNISGCPVNGPAIAARGDTLAVAWYTGADERSVVKVAFSGSDTEGFAPAFEMDFENPLGAVDVLLLDSGDAVVSWLGQDSDERAVFRLQRVSPSGTKGPQHQVAITSAGRMTGFPQMVSADGKIVLAWTDRVDEENVIRTAWIPLEEIDQSY